ncbi:hypothetical protein ACVVKC_004155 [Salmonella enterica subsp. diarizonae serovar 16:z10:e,n,x,z15]|nr:hypothetical protein [Salmonella enterica]HDC1597087.1 hypothetical protein [Salmonella enterica]HDC1601913.1 hypothetical protein [Salmonella enterica]
MKIEITFAPLVLYPGDWLAGWLAVRSSVPGACTDKEELPVMLLKDKEVPQNH